MKNFIKIKQLLTGFMLIPVFGISQTHTTSEGENSKTGIKWTKELAWEQIKEKAQTENKYIFVDCYATWCGPCKKMDKEIYNNDTVGGYFNEKFISVKVQMDTSKQDNETVKKWYEDAAYLKNKFKVSGFPTFLFLSSSGEIVHSDIGYKDVPDLIKIASNALDPQNQYYTLLNKYQAGVKDYSKMMYLAQTAKTLGEKELSNLISQDYLHNYLYKLSDDSLYTKDRISFIISLLNNTKERGFNMFYLHPDKIAEASKDSTLSQRVVNYLITKYDIDPNIWKNNYKEVVSDNPDWSKIYKTVSKKYKRIDQFNIDRMMVDAKVRWYGSQKKDFIEFTKAQAIFLVKYGERLNDVEINTCSWPIFLYSNSRQELETAMSLIGKYVKGEKAIDSFQRGTETDTYANILYKLGFKKEALEWELKALELDIKLNPKSDRFKKTIDKMNAGIKTWIVDIKK